MLLQTDQEAVFEAGRRSARKCAPAARREPADETSRPASESGQEFVSVSAAAASSAAAGTTAACPTGSASTGCSAASTARGVTAGALRFCFIAIPPTGLLGQDYGARLAGGQRWTGSVRVAHRWRGVTGAR